MDDSGFRFIYYGTRTTARQIEDFLNHTLKSNELAETEGKRKTPVCIWGKHGIGKTELVEGFANKHGYQLAYIAPAQFEEMGDLIGMPVVKNGKTVFAPPEWVPDRPGPGILLIDDLNRADDRILRGLMQLFQLYRLASWQLPAKWHIVATANPDGGDYSVTPLDDAMITRMMHITMEFDLKEWAWWAEKNRIDPRGIQFVLSNPDLVTGQRTTPRTLVQFFDAVAAIKDLQANAGMVQLLADSSLDEETAAAFLDFVKNDLSKLVDPRDVLNAKDFKKDIQSKLEGEGDTPLLTAEQFFVIVTRLSNFLNLYDDKLEVYQLNNIKDFIKLPGLPNDLRFSLARDLASSSNNHLKPIFDDPDIGMLLLDVL